MESRYKELADHATQVVERVFSGDLSKVNAKELGEVVDIIKDLEEAEMYCMKSCKLKYEKEYFKKVVESMNKSSDEEINHYLNKYSPEYYGKSVGLRKHYIEMMKNGVSEDKRINELTDYIHELGNDIVDMLIDATDSERHIVKQKLLELNSMI